MMELLTNFVIIHARVSAIAQPLVPRVLSTILAHVVREFTDVVSNLKDVPVNRILQVCRSFPLRMVRKSFLSVKLQLEVFCLRDTLQAFDSVPSSWDVIIPFVKQGVAFDRTGLNIPLFF